ncbi:MAG: hypothetical protein F6K09_12600 [Merismopedia sp. SIO2A8]|nr:hypothetical protein [Merismopedia sp. SIO2A8]
MQRNLQTQILKAAIVFACLLLPVLGWSPAADALPSFSISDLSYEECPPTAEYDNQVTPWGGMNMEAKCVLIHGNATNATNKPIINADVFGRIYDANGNSLMENRTRLGGIDEVPVGTSEFEIRISVAEEQPFPLQLKQFKGSGFTGKVRR